MKTTIIIHKKFNDLNFFIRSIKGLSLCAIFLASLFSSAYAQDIKYTKPSLWLGAAAGANFNFYNGSTQSLNSNLTVPVVFQKGFGIGLFAAPLIEFYKPGSIFGVMLQAGYDGRSAKFDGQTSPCNCPRDLSTKLSYITLEPNLRIAPFRNDFYLFVGPRFAFNMDKSFTYKQGTNPDFPDQVAPEDIEEDFSDMNQTIVSMQVGAGYDFHLSPDTKRTQFMLSPFVSFHPYFGQNPRSKETWNVSTVRVGVALKIGRGQKIMEPIAGTVADPKIKLSVSTPVNTPTVKRVIETFPIRNYIFFEQGSTEISKRYTLIKKSQVKDFKEDNLEAFTAKNTAARSSRQMSVYYNVINILGDRMDKNPSATVTLVGSSEKGSEDGKQMAQSVKDYLVNVFGINASRINVEGREKAKLPSEKPGTTESLDILLQEDRRVTIESSSPALLMEFQSGPEAPLRPIEIVSINGTVDSNFTCGFGGVNCTSYTLELRDEKNKVQYFGPYYQQQVSIPVNTILGSRSEGDYKLTMVGNTKSGKTMKIDTTIHLVKWVAPKMEEVMRFSILYEFNDSKAITIYKKYLTDVVAPKIPAGGTVRIMGFTDVIGEEDYNKNLSLSRANDVKSILEASLLQANRKDVKFEVVGNGEDKKLSPFENKYPEERFYNRTVIIDILPGK